jgi:hypothetical protein
LGERAEGLIEAAEQRASAAPSRDGTGWKVEKFSKSPIR